MTNKTKEILLNALAHAWLEKKIETVEEYMAAVRQVKELK